MRNRIIHSDNAPAAIGPYSQAVLAGGTLCYSGQIGIDPATGSLAEGLEAQVRQTFRNMSAVIAEAGFALEDVVKVTLFIQSMNDFPTINSIMAECFKAPFPARSCVEAAALPKGALFEAEAVAVRN